MEALLHTHQVQISYYIYRTGGSKSFKDIHSARTFYFSTFLSFPCPIEASQFIVSVNKRIEEFHGKIRKSGLNEPTAIAVASIHGNPIPIFKHASEAVAFLNEALEEMRLNDNDF